MHISVVSCSIQFVDVTTGKKSNAGMAFIVTLPHQLFTADEINAAQRNTTYYRTLIHCESKKGATLTIAITLSILDRFAQFFHCCKEQ